MKKLSKIIICLYCMLFSSISYAGVQFSDIENHWANEQIIRFAEDGFVNGYENGMFKPDEAVTNVEFLKIVLAAGRYDLIREGNLLWPDFYISTARKNNLINEDCVIVEKEITRYEACEIIANFINLSDVKKNSNKFKDLKDEYTDCVLKLVKIGIVSGYKDKTFKGENYLTRAEAITIISRAVDKKNELIEKRSYDYTDVKLSNYFSEQELKGAYSETRYEIKENNIYIFDDGRFSKLNEYAISKEIIDVSKVIKFIKNTVKENSYLAVLYQPSKYTINQLQLLYGLSEEKIACGEYDFSITLYENKKYELSRISMEEKFSNECIAKIEVLKLWDNYSNFLNNEYVDEKKEKLFKESISSLFGSNTKNMAEYMINKNKEYVSGKSFGIEQKEHKVFLNKYIVDFYQKADGVPTFYISEK